MIKINKTIKRIFFTLMFSFLFMPNLFAGDVEQNIGGYYGDRGTFELGGTVNSTYGSNSLKTKDNYIFSIGFNPYISYYILPHFHLGGGLGLGYLHYESKNNLSYKSYSLFPTVELGYLFTLKKQFFYFDLSIRSQKGYSVFIDNYDSNNNRTEKFRATYSVLPMLKIDTSNGLINIGILSYTYSPVTTIRSKHMIEFFIVGFGVYF